MTSLNTNLLTNPGAEDSQGTADFDSTAAPIGWTTTSKFSAVTYAAGGSIDLNPDDSAAVSGGINYFAGGVSNALATATQEIDFSDLATQVDSSLLRAELSGFIGGFDVQRDNLVIKATFFNASEEVLSSFSIGPVSNAERNDISKLLFRSAIVEVPVGARSALITLKAKRQDGSYNDGYADNLSFQLIENDCIEGTPNNDRLEGDRPSKSIHDCIEGLAGDDILNGLTGSDALVGGKGNDRLLGGEGNDVLHGGTGNDKLVGGSGQDSFVFDIGKPFTQSIGIDEISGFERSERIVIDKTTFKEIANDEVSFASVRSTSTAQRSNALIVYVRSSGALYYNQNRAEDGFGEGQQFAEIVDRFRLTKSNIAVQS